MDDFHEHLNRQNADIQFTKEIEENGKITFLDCLVTRDNNDNKLSTTIYKKTNTGPIILQPNLSQSNDHTGLNKASATGLRLTDSLTDENNY